MFMATERRDWRQIGRILVGIGLLILSLEMIGQASEPLRNSQLMPVIINYFSSDPITAYLLAALITWLFQSSIAAVLLMATLAGRGLDPARTRHRAGARRQSRLVDHRADADPQRRARSARRADRQSPDARRWARWSC